MNRAAVEKFLDTHAVALPHFDGATLDPELLAPLDDLLVRAGTVALGELNHFIHEKSDFRLFCARWLVSRGWTHFAEELGWSDGWRIDRFLQGKDERAFERLPSFNDLSHLRADRDDRPGGILKSEGYPAAEFAAEQKRFYSGLRNACAAARLTGFDIDALPGGAYDDIAAMLGPAAPEFRAALARRPGESAAGEAERLRAARTLLPPDSACELIAAVDALSESLDYIAMTYTAQTYDAVRPGMAFRERAMKRRLLEAGRLRGTENFVLMAHAAHLAKDDAHIVHAGVGPGGGREPSLGHWQARRRNMLSIWMLYGGGEDCQPLPTLPRKALYPADTLNAVLRERPPLLFFPREAPEIFGAPLRIGQIYNGVFETPLLAEADAVISVPVVSPLRSN